MSPYYEDAAHLLRFLASRGLTVPNCMSHHEIIEMIADRIEFIVDCGDDYTHAEAALFVVITINGLNNCVYGWLDEQPVLRQKFLSIIGASIGNLRAKYAKPARK